MEGKRAGAAAGAPPRCLLALNRHTVCLPAPHCCRLSTSNKDACEDRGRSAHSTAKAPQLCSSCGSAPGWTPGQGEEGAEQLDSHLLSARIQAHVVSCSTSSGPCPSAPVCPPGQGAEGSQPVVRFAIPKRNTFKSRSNSPSTSLCPSRPRRRRGSASMTKTRACGAPPMTRRWMTRCAAVHCSLPFTFRVYSLLCRRDFILLHSRLRPPACASAGRRPTGCGTLCACLTCAAEPQQLALWSGLVVAAARAVCPPLCIVVNSTPALVASPAGCGEAAPFDLSVDLQVALSPDANI